MDPGCKGSCGGKKNTTESQAAKNPSLSVKLPTRSPPTLVQKAMPGKHWAGGNFERGLKGPRPVRAEAEGSLPPVGPQGNLG